MEGSQGDVMLERLDFWLVILTLGFLGWLEFNRLRSWAVNRFFTDMSSAGEWEEDENDPPTVAATIATTQQQPIATPATDNNALLLQAKAEALAALVEAGAVTETKGLQLVFNVRPSSTNPRYLAARDALHAELEKRKGAPTPIAGRISKAQFPVR